MTTNRSNLNEYNWDIFFEEFQNETPRAAVIISGAFLDSLLRDLLASFMIENDKKAVDELLGTENNSDTPLSSFGARIKLAYCLGLISAVEYNDLKCIKFIRNKFAHKLHGYSFDEKEVVKYCDKLQTPIMFDGVLPSISESHHSKYVLAVSMLSSQLGLKILGVQRERRTIKDNVQLGQVVRL